MNQENQEDHVDRTPETPREGEATQERAEGQRSSSRSRSRRRPDRRRTEGRKQEGRRADGDGSVDEEGIPEAETEAEAQPKGKRQKKTIVVNCEKLETQVAMLHGDRLEEYQIERTQRGVVSGSVYLGRIQNHEPTLQAAFVDIGADRNAFLHYWDMLPAAEHLARQAEEQQRQGGGKKPTGLMRRLLDRFAKGKKGEDADGAKEITEADIKQIGTDEIPNLFPRGSEIIVQVSKGPIGPKGARVTTNLSIAGRYLVLLPYESTTAVSRKIEDREERGRIREVLSGLDNPDKAGFICRTNAEGADPLYFKRDADMLLALWQDINAKRASARAPALLHHEPNLLEQTMRDLFTDEIDAVVVDDTETWHRARDFVTRYVDQALTERVILYQKARPIFEHYKVSEQLRRIFNREVELPSGGRICFDETEALIAIDVNTGKSRSGKDQPETILRTNLEACDEIARQLRMRNVGGLVVIDFIDMRPAKHRAEVLGRMRRHARADRARSRILPISQLGLMEMTRQREQESVRDTMFDSCPYCAGRGRVKSSLTMSVEIQRRLEETLIRHQHEKDLALRVQLHPAVLARLKNEDAGLFAALEEEYGQQLTFRADDRLHHEEFKLIDPETGVEL
jgi:ribonuclease G